MTNLKEQISQLDEMTAPELDLLFFQTVLGDKQIQRLIDLPDYSITLGSRDGWKILHSELKKCFLVKETKLENCAVVLVQLKALKGVSIASGTTQAEATTKALILAHNEIHMTGLQLKEFRKAIKTKSGRHYTQAEFAKKIGSYSQQAQFRFEQGLRPVPAQVAKDTFELLVANLQ